MRRIDVSVIVLTKNEHLHIKRCLDNLSPFVEKIFVIDCYSSDDTIVIANKYDNVQVLQHQWPSTKYAGQFNWGLDNAGITTKWVLRMDADEYFTPELIRETLEKLPLLPDSVSGIVMKRRCVFMGSWVKMGTYPVKLLRFFRYGKGRCEQKLMDEHIQLTGEGEIVEFDNDFVDENLNNIAWFCHKHIDYAIREAVDLLDIELNLTGYAINDSQKNLNRQAQQKRKKKHRYAQKPLFWRSFAYFLYRYIFKGACFEGSIGFIHSFIQGWWYRTLADTIVFEIKQKCGNDRKMICEYLKEEYNIVI